MSAVREDQRLVCDRQGVEPVASPRHLKVGISRDVASGEAPIHGLRHPPSGDTTGWYIWTGEMSDAEDFFEPLHVDHLDTRVPEVVPYLALAPGWRFLIAPGYEDIWYDDSLLAV